MYIYSFSCVFISLCLNSSETVGSIKLKFRALFEAGFERSHCYTVLKGKTLSFEMVDCLEGLERKFELLISLFHTGFDILKLMVLHSLVEMLVIDRELSNQL